MLTADASGCGQCAKVDSGREVPELVVVDGVHHRRIRAVRDGVTDARFLAFELIPETTGQAGIITGRMPRPLKPIFRRDNQLLPLSNQKRKENYENNQSHAWRGFSRGVVLDFGMHHAA